MNDLIKINYDNDQPTVSARELHEFLEVGTAYKDWFPRMCEYGFERGRDFNPLKNEQVRFEGNRTVKRTVDDAEITIDMAKELCMLQRNERGKLARQYFLQLERDWNSPEKVMARALQIAEKKISTLTADLSKATVQNTIMAPKADYFDELVERNTLTNFRETAKQLGVKQKAFINFLMERKFIYRDKRGKLLPYADKNDGLFEVKECFNNATQWAGTQTLVTPKGRETFRLLCQGM
ncbi:MAG: phage antirepressor KilAC domain-containing protein [Evtepia sp.]